MQHVGEERSVALRVMVIGHEWIFSQAMSRQTPIYLVAEIDEENVEGADDETAPSSATALSK